MFERWILVKKDTQEVVMEGPLKDILEKLGVDSQEDIPTEYELKGAQPDRSTING